MAIHNKAISLKYCWTVKNITVYNNSPLITKLYVDIVTIRGQPHHGIILSIWAFCQSKLSLVNKYYTVETSITSKLLFCFMLNILFTEILTKAFLYFSNDSWYFKILESSFIKLVKIV